MVKTNKLSLTHCIAWFSLLIFLLGIYFRFYQITENQFVYYDEGMWLVQNHQFVEFAENLAPRNIKNISKWLNVSFHLSLHTGKALWAFISHLRGLVLGAEAYFFNRVVSAIFGVLTVLLSYVFAVKFTHSKMIGLLTVMLLALLPSHVYYSRLALQESISAFFFLSGIILYFQARGLSLKTFVSSVCFACVFFLNYRMIVIPVMLFFCEGYLGLSERKKPDYYKFTSNVLSFALIVFLIGAIDNGANRYVTFGWMGRQAQLAEGTFHFLNLFSFPYYIFKLEGVLFGCLFFSNIYLLVKRKWNKAFPFLFVVWFMLIFSFTQEKGVRYMTSSLPFMALAGASMISYLLESPMKKWSKVALAVCLGAMIISQLYYSGRISRFKSDYQSSIADIRHKNPKAKFISTQHMVQKLYVTDKKDVEAFRYGLSYLAQMLSNGYNYLIIDPQAYISFTEDQKRFSPKLKGYLSFIVKNVKPVKTYKHFNKALLERFVLEHNENLVRSIQFINSAEEQKYGRLRVYDIRLCIAQMKQGLKIYQEQRGVHAK